MTPQDLLRYTKTKSTEQYDVVIEQAPAVSKVLLAYLDRVFAPMQLLPNQDNMSQHLVYQHGIDAVKAHLRMLNDKQENQARLEFNQS